MSLNLGSDKMAITVYIVRHGQTLLNRYKKMQGWVDSPLTEKGIQDGKRAGKILENIKFDKFYESVFKDMDVILTNAQIVSDMITEAFRGFNEWFTDKYSKLIGTDDCMVDGEEFRKALKSWKNALSADKKEELNIMEDMIMDVIKASKNGQKYFQLKKLI